MFCLLCSPVPPVVLEMHWCRSGAPAAWITEETIPIPKNIYGVTKVAAEDLCQLFHRDHKLPCLILRTSRFFPEEDDDRNISDNYNDENVKVNEI